jgi:hypothetical protein
MLCRLFHILSAILFSLLVILAQLFYVCQPFYVLPVILLCSIFLFSYLILIISTIFLYMLLCYLITKSFLLKIVENVDP